MSAKSQAGTPEWTAPEVLRGQVSIPFPYLSCMPYQKCGRIYLYAETHVLGKQMSASSYACSLPSLEGGRD